MSFDIQQISASWETDKPLYEELGGLVAQFIEKKIPEEEIFPQVSHRTKELLSIVKKIKKKQKEKAYDYNSLNDKLGLRIICNFQEDMEIIDTFLQQYFTIVKTEKKRDALDYDKLDYISNHYDAKINTEITEFNSHSRFKDYVFEIQVRTLNQHAWSYSAHTLSYKQEAEIAPSLKRRIYRLLSLYEIADDEFSAVNNDLKIANDNPVYRLLRKLEGKIFRFAKVDYDRDTAISNLKILVSYFNTDQIKEIEESIESFIEENKDKISRIFDENRVRYFEIPFLTQPEVFLIWYAIENYSFSLDDNWHDDFDEFELDQIKTLWGITI